MFAKSISSSLALACTITALLVAAACGGDDEDAGGDAGSSGSGGSSGGSGSGGTSGSGGSSGSATGGSSGSGTSGTGGGGQSIDCKGTPCMSQFGAPCCTGPNGDKCGVDASMFIDGGSCVETNQPGNLDESCNPMFDAGGGGDGGRRVQGCCRPEGICGVQVPLLGCVDIRTFVDAGPPRTCTPM